MTSQEVMLLSERNDIMGRGGREVQEMTTRGDFAGMTLWNRRDEDVHAENYVAGNCVAGVCGNLRPRRGDDITRG